MKTFSEKRLSKRYLCETHIVFSSFNAKDFCTAQTLNHCMNGMCFKSPNPLKFGKTISIRVKSFKPNELYDGQCKGLRSLTLAEVKWCSELPDDKVSWYGIGVKYFAPPC